MVAVQMGRDFIGFELNPEYPELIKKRINDVSVPDPETAYPSSPEKPTSPTPAPSSTE